MTYDDVQVLKGRLAGACPGLTFVEKKDSALMRLFAKVLFFNPRFLDRFITTVGSTVYVPNIAEFEATRCNAAAQVYVHEAVHALDSKQLRFPVFAAAYLFPQVLALLALMSFGAVGGSAWWLINLLWLAALAPWPAPFRRTLELRAYAFGAVFAHTTGADRARSQALLSGPAYYWTCRDLDLLGHEFDVWVRVAQKAEGPAYATLRAALRDHWRAA